MSYTIDFTDRPNNGSITVEDQTVNLEKDISFVGKNYTGYAKIIAENFLHLLENFASASEPGNPVVGQLWYDTDVDNDPAQPQLKIYDGTNWQPAGSLKKAASVPEASSSIVGDLWVDTANQQLYLWSGSSWILVGPQFSEGTLTGPKVEQIIDTLSASHNIIIFYVSNIPLAIISKDEFTPKLVIDGFTTIKKGINIRDTNSSGVTTSDFRLFGTASNSAKLGGVDATNFLRSDTNSTTNYSLSIRSNSGLIIGSDLSASLTNNSAGATILYNKTEGSSIFIKTNKDGLANDTLTVSGSNVGINKTNPVYAMDVTGTIRSSDTLIVTGTNNANDLTTGSIKTAGGASITKTLQVGQGMTVLGTSNTNAILPTADSAFDIGSSQYGFKTIYANSVVAASFSGQFSGQLVGSVTGSASRLASATNFSISGDITSPVVSFNGQNGGAVTLVSTINSDFINSKDPVNIVNSDDVLLLQRPSIGLKKASVADFLSNAGVLPIGTIMPYAGAISPNGFLLCDGSEYLISDYNDLFLLIRYTYKPIGQLLGEGTFAVPDLRGRFPLGADNMYSGNQVPEAGNVGNYINTIDLTANRVSNVAADNLGAYDGTQDTTLQTSQLPDHKHDLRGTTNTGQKGQQYYAFRNSPDPTGDVDSVPHTTNGPTSPGSGQYLTNSGGVNSSILGSPLELMNPYLTLNYIIFAGKYI